MHCHVYTCTYILCLCTPQGLKWTSEHTKVEKRSVGYMYIPILFIVCIYTSGHVHVSARNPHYNHDYISRLGDYTREDLKSDLHQLSELEPSFIHSVAPDDIDPLLQVH